MHHNIFTKTLFCLGEEQGMIINSEAHGIIEYVINLMLVWERRKDILYGK